MVNENTLSFANRSAMVRVESKARKMGKKKGASDLVVIFNHKVLFLEMKRAGKKLKNGMLSYSGIAVSPHQERFLSAVAESSVCRSAVAYGYDQAMEVILKEI